MASEIPLCFGTSQHSDTSLICKRCKFEYRCYLAWNKKKRELKNAKDKKAADEAAE
ncbi:MAG: hypothetical protein U9Q97_06655 [Acidobacteriota bacterium]|nr:hypothetical protein [Acidobacteriota bacterium]